MTEPEKRLWWALRRIRLDRSHFRRQAPIGHYFVDFACHQSRLAIEIDGETHALPGAIAHDEKRSAFLRSRGYIVLRFLNSDVMTNIEGVMAAIENAMMQRDQKRPHP
jgi:very-short-patch-repair endonuclease